MKSPVEISIIVPIYNIDAYLYQCLNSIVSQSFKNIEIILVNDASTDQSLNICEYFRKSDNRVILINKNNNEGLVSARKSGIELATGKYAMYIDGDDWIANNYLEKIVNLIKDNMVDAVFPSHIREFFGTEKIINNKIKCGLYDKHNIQASILPKMISHGKFFSHGITSYSWGKLFLKDQLSKFQLKIPNEIVMGEDAALTFPILPALNSVYISDIAGYYYRQRPGSIVKLVTDYKGETRKLSSLFQFLKESLSKYPRDYRIKNQLANYVLALSLMRIGTQSTKKENAMSELLRHQNFHKDTKLCLYSSGSFGQNIYKSLIESNYIQLAGWVDEDYKESQMCGLEVSSVNEILNIDFDYVFIAALDPVLIQKAIKKLISLGVPKEIISNIHFQKDLIRQNIESLGFCSESYRLLD